MRKNPKLGLLMKISLIFLRNVLLLKNKNKLQKDRDGLLQEYLITGMVVKIKYLVSKTMEKKQFICCVKRK